MPNPLPTPWRAVAHGNDGGFLIVAADGEPAALVAPMSVRYGTTGARMTAERICAAVNNAGPLLGQSE